MKNRYEIDGPITRIFITRKNGEEYICFIDTEDLERIKTYLSSLHIDTRSHTNYVKGRYIGTSNCAPVYLHRFITGVEDQTAWVDHKNGNGLMNVKENLRVVTPTENTQNRSKNSSRGTGVRGVTYSKSGKYKAAVGDKYLGTYNTIEEADKVASYYRSTTFSYSRDDLEAELVGPYKLLSERPEAKKYGVLFTREKYYGWWTVDGRQYSTSGYYTKDAAEVQAKYCRENKIVKTNVKSHLGYNASLNKTTNKWEGRVNYKGKQKYVGAFLTKEAALSAARAYRLGLISDCLDYANEEEYQEAA